MIKRKHKPGAGRPKGPKPPRKVVSFTLSPDLLVRLDAYQQREMIKSRSELINQMLTESLNLKGDRHD